MSRQAIRRAKHINNNSIIVAVGCYAQVAKNDIEKDIPEIDLVLGTSEKNNIVKHIEEYIKYNENLRGLFLMLCNKRNF